MKISPLVSVIIPLYNGERYIRQALDSVFKQTYSPFEVIVVDDGSTDRSGALVQTFSGVRYIYQKNQGNATARNVGIAHAKGEFCASSIRMISGRKTNFPFKWIASSKIPIWALWSRGSSIFWTPRALPQCSCAAIS